MLRNHGDCPRTLAEAFRPLLDDSAARDALGILEADFTAPDSVGAMRVAPLPGSPGGRDVPRRRRRLRAENERLRGMLGLPPGALPEPDAEAPRLFPEDEPLPQVHVRSPAQEKIALFRALFRGREDVYARYYWCDERTGKKGYSPAARGRSGRGARDYLPLTDDYRHLAGEEVVGLYPTLQPGDRASWTNRGATDYRRR